MLDTSVEFNNGKLTGRLGVHCFECGGLISYSFGVRKGSLLYCDDCRNCIKRGD